MLLTKNHPEYAHVTKKYKKLLDIVQNALSAQQVVDIYVGYVSEESLDWLLKFNVPGKMLVGMASEGVTLGQYDMLKKLQTRGWHVRMSPTKYHGKAYVCRSKSWAVIGSTNLQSLISPNPGELDATLPEEDIVHLYPLLEMWWNMATDIKDWQLIARNALTEPLLTGEVSTVPVGLYKQTPNICSLEVKMLNASNFNASFAKPKSKNQKSRDWYEMEVNIPVKSAAAHLLPSDNDFYVITDDGFKFKCKRCGHEWASKQKDPTICPKCKSPYWNKERVHMMKVNV